MSDASSLKFIDSLGAKIPVWMSRSVGFRFLATMIFLADVGVETLLEAVDAMRPGVGTPTALPLHARSRGLIRGMSDTDASFAARLLLWLDRWHLAGTQLAIARAIQDYCAGAPKVKVVSRAGVMTTLESNGSSSVNLASGWDWDSISNPNRAGYWSECWVVIYAPPWAQFGAWPAGPSPFGALSIPFVDVDALRMLLSQWKGAHTFIRCVILTYDVTLFDPSDSSKMPNGKFGQWSYPTKATTERKISDRYAGAFAACRYLELERNPNVYPALQ
jgi:hypothetical protein